MSYIALSKFTPDLFLKGNKILVKCVLTNRRNNFTAYNYGEHSHAISDDYLEQENVATCNFREHNTEIISLWKILGCRFI